MSYHQLTSEERYVIYHLRLFKLSLREIARRLGRDHSTISRELKRNGPTVPSWVYWHETAQQKALKRRRLPRHRRRQIHRPLVTYVEKQLRAAWSPEVIAARLKLEYPEDRRMRLATETIYRWVYRDAVQGGTLFHALCRRHKKRRRQCRYGTGRSRFPGRVGIGERPAVVATRQRFGDWEGDTVEGAKGGGHLTTYVERKSRYLLAAKVPDKTAKATAEVVVALFRRIPKALRQTLTVDNGQEFARFQAIEQGTGLAVYFADPYSPWQRGCNENTNGLIRRDFPKGSDFRNLTDAQLAKLLKKFNHQPRKCLLYRTPHEVFHEACLGALGR